MVGVPKVGGSPGELDWLKWPTNQSLPSSAVGSNGVAITAFAKLRPCLVLTVREDIDAFGQTLVLPISTFKPGNAVEDALVRRNQIPHFHFFAGEPTMNFDDATVDFRWTWRVRAEDLKYGRFEGRLHPEVLAQLLLRFRDYLYLAPEP
jgi:hypothetical protein